MLDRATIRTFWRGIIFSWTVPSASFPSALFLAMLIGWALPGVATAQEATPAAETPTAPAVPATMPEGWRQLGATEFAAAMDAMYQARPRAEAAHVAEVVLHAWTAFLSDESFVAEGDWMTLRTLLKTGLRNRTLLVEGQTPEARAASSDEIDQRLAAVASQVQSRLDANPQTLASLSFEDLKLSNATLRDAKLTIDQRGAYLVAWMNANDWRELPFEDQAWLNMFFSGVDQVDPKCVSIRWTGVLRAPADGTYRFEQTRTYYSDGKMKLWIDDQVVLDSPGVRHEEDCYCEIQPEVAQEKFVSSPVALRAGEAVDFRLEYVHDMTGAKLRGIYPMGFPVAVLTWESDLVERQVVPQNAFTPPAGFAEPGEKGLKGEYFADAAFGEKKATRLDPAIDFAWQRRSPVLAKYAAQREALAGSLAPRLTSPTYLASRAADAKGAVPFVRESLCNAMEGLPPTQRLAVAGALAEQPDLLKHLWYSDVRRLLDTIYMLPGKGHLELLAAWSETRAHPRMQVVRFAGWSEGSFPRGSYERVNYQKPWELGRLFCRAYFDDCETIWRDHLDMPNGECDIRLVHVTAFATKLTRGKNGRIREVLDERLADEELTGDRRVTWLLARAFAEEVAIARKARPGRGNRYLEEALAAAETPEYRFWALQELVARLAACNHCQEAVSLIESVQGQFTDAGHKKQIAAWLKRIDAMPAYYAGLENKVRQSSIDAYRAEMGRRIASAEARGESQLAARYRAMIAPPPDPQAKSQTESLNP